MYRRQETDSDHSFTVDVLKIALGVFIGGLLAAFTYEGIQAWRLQHAAQQAAEAFKARQAQQDQVRWEQERLRTDREQANEKQRQKAAAAQADRIAADKAKAARKEAAWAQFYQPNVTCRADPSRGDCADAHIRARKVFEATYQDR